MVARARPKPGPLDFIVSAFDVAVAGSLQKANSKIDLHADNILRNILGIY